MARLKKGNKTQGNIMCNKAQPLKNCLSVALFSVILSRTMYKTNAFFDTFLTYNLYILVGDFDIFKSIYFRLIGYIPT